MKYLWTEDSKAGYHYWQLINQYCWGNALIVESKYNNQQLLEAVRSVADDKDNMYYIAFDTVFDNMDIMNKYIELCEIATKNPEHIILMDITCFEESIFCFDRLIEWTNCKRKDKIHIRQVILDNFDKHRIAIENIDDDATLQYLKGFKRYSTERVLKSITTELTDKDGWSIRGEKMGVCWYKDCCQLIRSDCGLNANSNMKGKMKIIEVGKSNGHDKFHI